MNGIKVELKLKFCTISKAKIGSADFLTIEINLF